MANNTVIRNLRLAFPNLYEKTSFRGIKDPKTDAYSASFLISKFDKKQLRVINNVVRDTKRGAKLISCIKDGDVEPFCNYDGHKGHYIIKSKSRREITLLDSRNQLQAEDVGLFYAGCNVDVILSFRAAGDHLASYINAIRFNSDNTHFIGDSALLPEAIINLFDNPENETHNQEPSSDDTIYDTINDTINDTVNDMVDNVDDEYSKDLSYIEDSDD